MRFNARGPDGLLDGKAPGQPSKLNDAQRQTIAQDDRGSGPDPGGPRRGALAADRPGAMDLSKKFRTHTLPKQTLEPGIAGHGLSQAIGPATPGHARRRRR